MDHIIEEFTAKDGDVLKIYQDPHADTPRSWDNLSRMIFLGSKRHLGDKHDFESGQYGSRSDFMYQGEKDVIKHFKDVAYSRPVHYYEHSGCGISTRYVYPYNCRWDSGTIGFVIVTKEDIRKNWGIKRVTQKYVNQAAEIAEAEVETLNKWLAGEVVGYVHETGDEDHVDSCWGFYGLNYGENGLLDYVDEKFHNQLKY